MDSAGYRGSCYGEQPHPHPHYWTASHHYHHHHHHHPNGIPSAGHNPHWTPVGHQKCEPPPPKRYLIPDVVSGKGKDSPEKKEDGSDLWTNVEAQAAFLGPNLWDKTLPYDTDLKYVDLDEFLSENGMPVMPVETGKDERISPASGSTTILTKREPSPSPSETVDSLDIPPSPASTHADSSTYLTMPYASPGGSFDPRTRAFSDEELKPQPLVKKSRKQRNNNNGSAQFVPDTLKDEKYWARRRKNNAAAKRSRDARRMKENQIALRAGYLEKENLGLRQEMDRLKKENMALRERLSKFTSEI